VKLPLPPTVNTTLPIKASLYFCFVHQIEYGNSPVPVTPKGPDDNARALSEKQSEWHNMAQLITLTLTENALNKEPNKPTPSHTKRHVPYATGGGQAIKIACEPGLV